MEQAQKIGQFRPMLREPVAIVEGPRRERAEAEQFGPMSGERDVSREPLREIRQPRPMLGESVSSTEGLRKERDRTEQSRPMSGGRGVLTERGGTAQTDVAPGRGGAVWADVRTSRRIAGS